MKLVEFIPTGIPAFLLVFAVVLMSNQNTSASASKENGKLLMLYKFLLVISLLLTLYFGAILFYKLTQSSDSLSNMKRHANSVSSFYGYSSLITTFLISLFTFVICCLAIRSFYVITDPHMLAITIRPHPQIILSLSVVYIVYYLVFINLNYE